MWYCVRFWEACQQLKYARQADVQNTVQDIYTYDSHVYYHALTDDISATFCDQLV